MPRLRGVKVIGCFGVAFCVFVFGMSQSANGEMCLFVLEYGGRGAAGGFMDIVVRAIWRSVAVRFRVCVYVCVMRTAMASVFSSMDARGVSHEYSGMFREYGDETYRAAKDKTWILVRWLTIDSIDLPRE